MLYLLSIFVLHIDTGSCVVKNDLAFLIILPPLPKFWDSGCVTACLVSLDSTGGCFLFLFSSSTVNVQNLIISSEFYPTQPFGTS